MHLELRPVTQADAETHHAGEDDEIVHWLSGGKAPLERVRAYFAELIANAEAGSGKQGLSIWLDGRHAGLVDYDAAVTDGLEPTDLNIAYCVYPWARGRGVAAEAVRQLVTHLAEHEPGRRAAIRVEPENVASVRTAERAGFRFVRRFVSQTDTDADGRPLMMLLYRPADVTA